MRKLGLWNVQGLGHSHAAGDTEVSLASPRVPHSNKGYVSGSDLPLSSLTSIPWCHCLPVPLYFWGSRGSLLGSQQPFSSPPGWVCFGEDYGLERKLVKVPACCQGSWCLPPKELISKAQSHRVPQVTSVPAYHRHYVSVVALLSDMSVVKPPKWGETLTLFNVKLHSLSLKAVPTCPYSNGLQSWVKTLLFNFVITFLKVLVRP